MILREKCVLFLYTKISRPNTTSFLQKSLHLVAFEFLADTGDQGQKVIWKNENIPFQRVDLQF